MNLFRHLLKAAGSHPPMGTWIMSASPLMAEATAHAGFDWAVVDMEHSPLDTMHVMHMLQVTCGSRMVPVVRVPWNDAVMVKRVLDVGATTVMFPYVQDAEEARRAVAATRYPPQGVRGMAGMSRASKFGTQPNYLKTANQHMGVIVQLETPKALQSLEAMADVEGVDALFVGPADLAGSMGHPGQVNHPEVMAKMAEAARRGRAAGKPIGTLAGSTDLAAQYRAMGYDYIAIGSDLGLFMQGAAAALNALRTQEVGSHVHSVHSGTRTDGY